MCAVASFRTWLGNYCLPEFTKEKLSAATSIIIESDDSNWNMDSTSERYLVWVWYKTEESEEYKNLSKSNQNNKNKHDIYIIHCSSLQRRKC